MPLFFSIKKYALHFLVVGLILTQVFPTFGNSLGFTGNYVPITIGGGVAIFGLLIALLGGKGGQYIWHMVFVLSLALVVPFLVILGNILTQDPSGRIFADSARPILLAVFVLAGLQAAKISNGSIRIPVLILLISLLVNALIFFSFLYDTGSIFVELYRTRVIGGLQVGRARFTGAWNYPYNLSVFLVPALIALLYLFAVEKRSLTKSAILFLSIVTTAMLLLGQARSSVIALILCFLFSLLLLFVRKISQKKFSDPGFSSTLAAHLIFLSAAAFALVAYTEEVMSYLGRLSSFYEDGISEAANMDTRVNRIVRAIEFFESSPVSFMFGFSRSSGVFGAVGFESGVQYIAIYGFLGSIFFVGIPLILALLSGFSARVSLSSKYNVAFSFLFFLAISALIHLPANTIFLHFRFLPLFGFMLGYVLWVRKNFKKIEGEPI